MINSRLKGEKTHSLVIFRHSRPQTYRRTDKQLVILQQWI